MALRKAAEALPAGWWSMVGVGALLILGFREKRDRAALKLASRHSGRSVVTFPARALVVAVVGAGLVAPAFAMESDPVSVVEEFVDALSRADLEALLSNVARDATVFAPLPSAPRRIEGRKDIEALFEPFFSRILENADGPVDTNLVPRDLEVQELGDSAVVTFHLGQVPDEPIAESYSFSRRTFVLRLTDGRWQIVHFHGSSVTIPPRAVEDR